MDCINNVNVENNIGYVIREIKPNDEIIAHPGPKPIWNQVFYNWIL